MPLLLLPLDGAKLGRGIRAPAAPEPAALGHDGGREPGEKGKGSAGNRFPLLIWAEAVCRAGAKGAGGVCGGGTTRLGSG